MNIIQGHIVPTANSTNSAAISGADAHKLNHIVYKIAAIDDTAYLTIEELQTAYANQINAPAAIAITSKAGGITRGIYELNANPPELITEFFHGLTCYVNSNDQLYKYHQDLNEELLQLTETTAIQYRLVDIEQEQTFLNTSTTANTGIAVNNDDVFATRVGAGHANIEASWGTFETPLLTDEDNSAHYKRTDTAQEGVLLDFNCSQNMYFRYVKITKRAYSKPNSFAERTQHLRIRLLLDDAVVFESEDTNLTFNASDVATINIFDESSNLIEATRIQLFMSKDADDSGHTQYRVIRAGALRRDQVATRTETTIIGQRVERV